MTRSRGRAPIGARLIDRTPHGHWKTTTLIAALDATGIRCSTVVDGAVNAEVFEAFVDQVLVPTLRRGDVVVMDNLSSHKREKTRRLIESAGAQARFLPPFSPDLKTLENAVSKAKEGLRPMTCRASGALWAAMQSVLDRVNASDAINCFRHCGYTLRTN